jgi:hypothetical protein
MSNSPAPASRVADYFFVAGLYDKHLISTFETAKKYQRTSDSDVFYYKQQEAAAAASGNHSDSEILSSSPPEIERPRSQQEYQRKSRGYTVVAEPSTILRSTLSEEATSASLLGVLDHVQHVIDNFDKERDTARDNVIAVQNPNNGLVTEKYKQSDSDKTLNNRLSTYSVEGTATTTTKSMSTRKWRSPSDPKRRTYIKDVNLIYIYIYECVGLITIYNR